jgi:two-component system KDP operon response regulator KdpE
LADPRRILVIDDEAAIRRFLRASLDPAEYELLEAETAAQGIRLAATQNPAVILLDLGLPDMDGVELARSIR